MRAYLESKTARTTYRLLYDLPPNDPRFLSITEDEIVFDLCVRAYASHATAADSGDPRALAAEIAAAQDANGVEDNEADEREERENAKVAALMAGPASTDPPLLTSISIGEGKIGT